MSAAANFVLEGRITAYTAPPIWRAAVELLARNPDQPLVIDASRLEYVDNVGIALLFDLIRRERPPAAKVEVRNLAPTLASLVAAYDPKDFEQAPPTHSQTGIFEHLGRATAEQIDHARDMLGFLGDCLTAFVVGVRRRGAIRWGEVLDVATEAGANAVPIVLLIGFLMGVIIAFEIGLVAQQFGAVIFVVNGVGVAMLRELGPLMTAIVFAGRTGAAFAAQIGTQKVNEEVNAISTFGLDPVHFLVLPRLLAAALVMPLLDRARRPDRAVRRRAGDGHLRRRVRPVLQPVARRGTAGDFVIGIVKAVVFGLMIAAIGCQRGLATGAGATSVGLSATSAVVTSIVMIVVIDGLFAVLTS